jgi:hypothetical protein
MTCFTYKYYPSYSRHPLCRCLTSNFYKCPMSSYETTFNYKWLNHAFTQTFVVKVLPLVQTKI